MKNETKIIIGLSIILLISLLANGYFLGNNDSADYAERIRLYEELNKQFNTTEELLQDRINEAEETIGGLERVSAELRDTVRDFEESNAKRERLDTISSEINSRIGTEIIGGIQSIDSGTSGLTELERAEGETRQALSGIIGGSESTED